MSFDAITSIAQAEDAAKVAVQYARAQAKQMLADLRKKSDEKSVSDAKKLRRELDTKKAILRAGAESKLEAAATLVAERIVNG